MKSLKKTRRIQVIVVAVVSLVAAVSIVGVAFQDGINLFRSPTQVLEDVPTPNEVFKIGGLVLEGSLVIGGGEEIQFVVTDGGSEVPVTYTGIRPDLFNEGQGTIATGTYVNGVFQATEILAKHDESYMPKEVVDALKAQGVYQGE